MATLKLLRQQIDSMIAEHGDDYLAAMFLIDESDIENTSRLDFDSQEFDEGDDEPVANYQPLSKQQLLAAIHELETSSAGIAKLHGVPLHEALNAAYALDPLAPAATGDD
jgi:hypothetical protein